jgi:hypothetical protein
MRSSCVSQPREAREVGHVVPLPAER